MRAERADERADSDQGLDRSRDSPRSATHIERDQPSSRFVAAVTSKLARRSASIAAPRLKPIAVSCETAASCRGGIGWGNRMEEPDGGTG